MKIGEIPIKNLASLLVKTGLPLQAGPFSIRLHTDVPEIVQPFQNLYKDFQSDQKTEFFDFHVNIQRARGIRRWWRPQVSFLVQNERFFYPFPLSLAFPLLEWGLNWSISSYAHQYLIIHSAVMERNGRAMLLIASPGGGKSTLAAALAFRGWRLLTDELALIRRDEAQISPLPRPISIKNDSIQIIRNYAPQAVIGPVWHDPEGTIAHVRPPQESVLRSNEYAIPRIILFMRYVPGSQTELKTVAKSRAFIQLGQHSFNYSTLGSSGFETMANLMDLCDCYDFSYSDLDDAVDHLASL